MSAPPSADRSSIEIKDLLRKLHPSSNNNHKDRIRRLNKFRNYVQPSVRFMILVDFPLVYIMLLSFDAAAVAVVVTVGW
jgi:hypothetical protein